MKEKLKPERQRDEGKEDVQRGDMMNHYYYQKTIKELQESV